MQAISRLAVEEYCMLVLSECPARKKKETRREIFRKIKKEPKKDVIVVNNQDSKRSFNQQHKKVLHVQEKESMQNRDMINVRKFRIHMTVQIFGHRLFESLFFLIIH